ncbi:unnamed protein product [Owenia fusiformis]|uniref:Uncharacterized protein n=1 Tax=Owenia fusiformis TaxID=6347 RepID=A0A8J1UHB8_OWEFU|nr:unnamed protein product [Owenia fusiformis]
MAQCPALSSFTGPPTVITLNNVHWLQLDTYVRTEGTVVNINCYSTHTLSGASRLTCINKAGVTDWDSPIPTCEPKQTSDTGIDTSSGTIFDNMTEEQKIITGVAIAVGILVLLVLILLIICVCCWQRKKKNKIVKHIYSSDYRDDYRDWDLRDHSESSSYHHRVKNGPPPAIAYNSSYDNLHTRQEPRTYSVHDDQPRHQVARQPQDIQWVEEVIRRPIITPANSYVEQVPMTDRIVAPTNTGFPPGYDRPRSSEISSMFTIPRPITSHQKTHDYRYPTPSYYTNADTFY